ncbi:MAG: DsbA family oxidoreductase [Rhodospirillaceae bacterium]
MTDAAATGTEQPSADLPDLRIDIVSDVVCPWCVIGFLQLRAALDDLEEDAIVRWHPFELNPEMEADGQNLREHVKEKYDASPEDSQKAREAITALAGEHGFAINFAEDTRIYPTFQAHQLIAWASTKGAAHRLKMALFKAYFTDRLKVSDPAVLADCAELAGLDRTEALTVLEGDQFAEAVKAAEAVWTQNGINGVPAMIFQGRLLVQGAQGVENYKEIVRQVKAGLADQIAEEGGEAPQA